jgi:hypothetical protein
MRGRSELPVPCSVNPLDRSKNRACPTPKLWQSRARNGDNLAQRLDARVGAKVKNEGLVFDAET